LIDAIAMLERATNPKLFKSAWLKRERVSNKFSAALKKVSDQVLAFVQRVG